MELYGEQLKKPNTTVVECDKFESYFNQQIRELEGSSETYAGRGASQLRVDDLTPSSSSENGDEAPPMPGLTPSNSGLKKPESTKTSTESTPIPTPDTSRPSTPASHLLAGKAGPKGASRRARKAASGAPAASSGDERKNKSNANKKDNTKKMRRWDDAGVADEDDGAVLDYSAQGPDVEGAAEDPNTTIDAVDMQASGTRTGKGQYVLKDLDDQVHSILQKANAKKSQPSATPKDGIVNSSIGAISGLFRNIVGGKTLTKADLDKALKGMETHLLNKNVAREAAVRLCESVERDLLDTKTASFESVDATLRAAMSSALHKILTPTTSLDILRSVTAVTTHQKRPYVISIVGVNGVGKSTNLSKLAFFLLQNNHSLLIAACDTFRSGAVEQLRVHARNLSELSSREKRGSIELYERGYGKDAASIAKDAIAYAASRNIDVVLIDTAGRRHNDTRLMSSLEKFATLAQPDKILMVGEALVGSDAVAQARAFNAAFGAKRGLDGFIISKCDTVGEMVGTLVSMVHATGIPVVFLGTGQHYGDLRTLSVDSTVGLLMS